MVTPRSYITDTDINQRHMPNFLPQLHRCLKQETSIDVMRLFSQLTKRTKTNEDVKMICDDPIQFRMLQNELRSSKLVTNVALSEILPGIINSQAQEIKKSKNHEPIKRKTGRYYLWGSMESFCAMVGKVNDAASKSFLNGSNSDLETGEALWEKKESIAKHQVLPGRKI